MESSTDATVPGFSAFPPSLTSTALQTAVLVPTFLTNVFGNICVCVAVRCVRSLQQKPSSSILASLAVSDFSMLSFLLFRLIWLYDFEAACKVCEFFLMLLGTFAFVDVLHIFLLSCDRYIAIVLPLRHATVVTTTRVRLAVLVAWGAPLISIVVFPLFYGESVVSQYRPRTSIIGCSQSGKLSLLHRVHIAFNATLFVAIPFVAMVFVYGHIAKISWFQSNRVQPGENLNPETAELWRKKKKELKWMKTIAMKIGAFTFCYIPAFVCVLVTAKLGPNRVPNGLRSTVVVMIVVNSALNPIIYMIRSNEFKQAFRKIFRGVASLEPSNATARTARGGETRLDAFTCAVQNDLLSFIGDKLVNATVTPAEQSRPSQDHT